MSRKDSRWYKKKFINKMSLYVTRPLQLKPVTIFEFPLTPKVNVEFFKLYKLMWQHMRTEHRCLHPEHILLKEIYEPAVFKKICYKTV
jgi:hypothetical protein